MKKIVWLMKIQCPLTINLILTYNFCRSARAVLPKAKHTLQLTTKEW